MTKQTSNKDHTFHNNKSCLFLKECTFAQLQSFRDMALPIFTAGRSSDKIMVMPTLSLTVGEVAVWSLVTRNSTSFGVCAGVVTVNSARQHGKVSSQNTWLSHWMFYIISSLCCFSNGVGSLMSCLPSVMCKTAGLIFNLKMSFHGPVRVFRDHAEFYLNVIHDKDLTKTSLLLATCWDQYHPAKWQAKK